jgi:hypothetical protein
MRIGLDIDDVIADFIGAYCARYALNRPTDWIFDPHFAERYADICRDRVFWQMLTVLDRPAFTPYCYITARGCPESWTLEWLHDNGLPYAPVYYVGLGGTKVDIARELQLDLFVDDCIANFVDLTRAGVRCMLYTSTHNEGFDVGGQRIHNLSEIVDR